MVDSQQDNASSTGQVGTAACFLDAHFEACRDAYETMLRSVGLEAGWHVLDAGCGAGSFLPLIAELVGPGGRLAALDWAADNIAAVEARTKHLPCSVVGRTGADANVGFVGTPRAADTRARKPAVFSGGSALPGAGPQL